MKCASNSRRVNLLKVLTALAVSVLVAGTAAAAAPRIDQSQLEGLGFKVLVATTTVQEQWVKGLPPGQFKAMQRNGNKYFIYPDAPGKRVYVGGPAEYAAYKQLHPETQNSAEKAASAASADSRYRGKQDDVMRAASARDLSNPWLGVTWADLGW